MKSTILPTALLSSLLGLCSVKSGAKTIHVRASGDDNNNGNNWSQSYKTVQKALAVAGNNDVIYVGVGTYYPATNASNRSPSFVLKNNVTIYGGFPGSGNSMLNDRNVTTFPTILSGDLLQNDGPGFSNYADNATNVVDGSNTNATAILDGFTITGGNANLLDLFFNPGRSGGGMYNQNGSPTVTNCIFTRNAASDYGSGMFNYNGSSPTVTNCSFIQNQGSNYGGGIANYTNSSPAVSNCTFSGNRANNGGGGMYNTTASNPVITGSSFSQNFAANGGGLLSDLSSPQLSNCSIVADTATTSAGGIGFIGATPKMINCQISGNVSQLSGGGLVLSQVLAGVISNCLFAGNSASSQGGACLVGLLTTASLINSTFTGNTAEDGGAIYSGSAVQISNSIIWNNKSGGSLTSPAASISNGLLKCVVSYSTIANSGGSGNWNPAIGTDAGTNTDIDPLFITPINFSAVPVYTSGNLRLSSCSPALNSGNNASIPAGVTLDLAGAPRIFGGIVDKGPYELQSAAVNSIATGTLATTQPITANGNIIFQNNCVFIAALQSTGIRPVNGNINTVVWVETQPVVVNNKVYVARHYQLAPETNPNTASGRITLYFTQAEFNVFNAASNTDVNLPVGPTDSAGISHLRVYRFGGLSANGLPGGYTGGVTELNPAESDILWNSPANRWEVSALTVGFGGFLAGTSDSIALCSGGSSTLYSSTTGSTYLWQTLSGNTWVAASDPVHLSGITTPTLRISDYPTTLYGTKFRCVVNGSNAGPAYTIVFATYWTGSASTSWNNPANWSCGTLPDKFTDVIIGNNVLLYPVLNNSGAARSVRILPTGNLTVPATNPLNVGGN